MSEQEATVEIPLSLAQELAQYIQNNPSPMQPVSVALRLLAQLQTAAQPKQEQRE